MTSTEEALAEIIRANLRIGPIGPNSRAILEGGGRVLLTPGEAEELARTIVASDLWRDRAVAPAPSAHKRDSLGICRTCGEGLTARDIVDGERPCALVAGPVDDAAVYVLDGELARDDAHHDLLPLPLAFETRVQAEAYVGSQQPLWGSWEIQRVALAARPVEDVDAWNINEATVKAEPGMNARHAVFGGDQ